MKLTKTIFFLLFFSSISHAQIYLPQGLKGYWTFDNASDLLHADYGNNLQLSGSHSAVQGPSAIDNAIKIGVGSYYTCLHNIPINGNGTQKVNRYSILIDFKVEQIGRWYSLFQTNTANNDDGEVFIDPSGKIGVSATGYSSVTIVPYKWYRLVISADLGSSFNYYLDGQLILAGSSQAADGRFALNPLSGNNSFLLFADDNGEDNEIFISSAAIFDRALTAIQVDSIGGYDNTPEGMFPYLQTPSPNSMYVSWHFYPYGNPTIQQPIVHYGSSPTQLNLQKTGTYENISGKLWNTVVLDNLQPNTTYYYQCYSNEDSSEIYPFHTPRVITDHNDHLRFVIIGDTRTDITKTTEIAEAMKQHLINEYGPSWFEYIDLIMHVGDICTDGSSISLYDSEYFIPYKSLSCSVPFMVSIGNHEQENASYYKYMKYESLYDATFPSTYREKFYSFRLGNTKFLSLNSNSDFYITEQTDWVNEQLSLSQADTSIDFVFSFSHHPGRTEIWPDGNIPYIQNNIYNVLKNYPKLMMHSYGHSHDYERGAFLSTHQNNWDFRLLLSGGGGSPLDRWGMYPNQTNYPEIQKTMDIYCYVLVDVDMTNKSYDAKTYSFGHTDALHFDELIDEWHFIQNQPAADKPIAMQPFNIMPAITTLTASAFTGLDSLLSSQFQLVLNGGSWNLPIINVMRDNEDFYGDSGSPNYNPINLNLGIDLRRYNIPLGILQNGNSYIWRVRYRDNNMKWSQWSDSALFIFDNNANDSVEFTVNTRSGTPDYRFNFSDISRGQAISWDWDFNNDGIIDSHNRDASYIYNQPGMYSVKLSITFSSGSKSLIKDNYIYVQTADVKPISKADDVVKIFPNPASNTISLDFTLKKKDDIIINVFDIKGVNIKKYSFQGKNAGSHSIHINTSDFTKEGQTESVVIQINCKEFDVKKVITIKR